MALSVQSTSSSKAEEAISVFLAEHYSGIVSTADASANPHAAVVYYLPDPDFSISFVTKEETQKFKNIQENKQVAFVIYDEKQQTSLQIFGRVVIVEDREKKHDTIRNMTNSSIALSGRLLPPAYKLTAGDYKVLQIVPQSMKLAVYARADGEDDLYETLLFNDV